MRVIHLNGMEIVHVGCTWPHVGVDPSSKNAIEKLELNESLVTWLQPMGGVIEEQFPVIRLNDKEFYVLSLRCMKVGRLPLCCTLRQAI